MGRKKLSPDFTPENLGKNPLVDTEFQIKVTKIKKKRRVVEVSSIDLDEDIITYGEVETLESTQTLEAENYTKVYTNPHYRRHLANLSSRGRDLYLWLIYSIRPSKDYIVLNRELAMQELNISKMTLIGAISDLVKEVIICPSAFQGVYWINPRFFFNGSRINKYPDNLVVETR